MSLFLLLLRQAGPAVFLAACHLVYPIPGWADGLRLKTAASLAQGGAEGPRVSESGASTPGAKQQSVAPFLSHLALRAAEYQPTILAADASRRADSERVEQARGALRPQVSGVLGAQREFADSGATQAFTGLSGGVRLALPLYRPQSDAAINVAEAQLRSTEFAQAETRRDVLARVVDTYLLAAFFEEEAELLQAERALLLRQRAINERRVTGGIGTRVEVIETAARADAVQSLVSGSQGNYRQQLAELERLSAVPVSGVRRVRSGEPDVLVPPTVAAALVQGRERNATLSRLSAALATARETVTLQRGGARPAVDLVGNVDQARNHFNPGTVGAPSTAIGVQLTVPLWTGGVIESRVREAMARVERAEADLRDAELSLQSDLAKAYADLERARAQWLTQRGVLEIANQAMEATTKAFDAGVRSNIDLLNSQQFVFSARREELRVRVAILAAQARILALVQGLAPEMLVRLDGAFGG